MRYYLLLLCLLFTTYGFGQDGELDKNFKSLQINSTPAFVMLGVEPENIQRPNSPTQFAANVQNAVVNGILQPNFALETTPYYWSHPKENSTRNNLLNYISSTNYGENLARSITFSLATSSTDSLTFGNIPSGTGFGIGLHLQLIQGHVSENTRVNILTLCSDIAIQGILESLLATLEADKNIDNVDDRIELEIQRLADQPMFNKYSETDKRSIKELLRLQIRKKSLTPDNKPAIQLLINRIKKKSVEANSKLNKIPITREGFMLELAVADAGISEQSKWNKLTNAKTALWLTPSYRFNINQDPEVIDFIDIMGVARYTFNSRQVDSSDYLDAGLKLQWLHNKISFSAEGVMRYLTEKPATFTKNYTYRADVAFNYKVSDLITFKVTFGTNFDGNSAHYSDPKKMFAVGGFNFGFGDLFKQAK